MTDTSKRTWDDIRARRQLRTRTEWVALDAGLLTQIDELERRITEEARADERQHRRPVAPRLRKELDELVAQADEAAVPFTLTELPRRLYRTLLDVHPPTDADRARKINRWHEDGFAPALIAATVVEPELTTIPRADYLDLIRPGVKAAKLREHIAPAVEVWDEWANSIAYLLFGAAYELQEGGSQVPFTVRSSSGTNGSEPSSTTAHPEA